jgi:hypothetical protein
MVVLTPVLLNLLVWEVGALAACQCRWIVIMASEEPEAVVKS